MPTRKRAARSSKTTDWQARAAGLRLLLDLAIAEAGLPAARKEVQFARATIGRRWALDLGWPDLRIAVEIEGRGRHQRWPGYVKDIEKYNTLAVMGWLLIRVTYDMIEAGEAMKFICDAFTARQRGAAA